jgi:hypothetical protein
MAESIIGLFKTKVIRLVAPGDMWTPVEFATLSGSTGLITAGCPKRLGMCHRAEYEARYYEQAAVV